MCLPKTPYAVRASDLQKRHQVRGAPRTHRQDHLPGTIMAILDRLGPPNSPPRVEPSWWDQVPRSAPPRRQTLLWNCPRSYRSLHSLGKPGCLSGLGGHQCRIPAPERHIQATRSPLSPSDKALARGLSFLSSPLASAPRRKLLSQVGVQRRSGASSYERNLRRGALGPGIGGRLTQVPVRQYRRELARQSMGGLCSTHGTERIATTSFRHSTRVFD